MSITTEQFPQISIACFLQDKLAEMSIRHAAEREELDAQLAGLSEGEKREIKALQAQQHEAEVADLNYRLRLEQDEEAEKLRKVSHENFHNSRFCVIVSKYF